MEQYITQLIGEDRIKLIRKEYEEKKKKELLLKQSQKGFLNKLFKIDFDTDGIIGEFFSSDNINVSRRLNVQITSTGRIFLIGLLGVLGLAIYLARRK